MLVLAQSFLSNSYQVKHSLDLPQAPSGTIEYTIPHAIQKILHQTGPSIRHWVWPESINHTRCIALAVSASRLPNGCITTAIQIDAEERLQAEAGGGVGCGIWMPSTRYLWSKASRAIMTSWRTIIETFQQDPATSDSVVEEKLPKICGLWIPFTRLIKAHH